MGLARLVQHLYPDLEPGEDYRVMQHEDGTESLVWLSAATPEPTPEQLAAAELPVVKAKKISEFAAHAIDDLSPLFTDGAGRDETALLIASHVLKICQALGITPDPRLSQVVSTGEKALQKKAEVEAATTPAEVEGITWTP